ncbi:DUF5753 domain-containing protein [Nocardiopsis sp. NPDC006938]|uniref:DUF5753 domain-containing protein n=1 Tax=Nocardiopsis sp. NPDC006938 TaxID=3364337 RepID=UPI0036784CC0
MRWEDGGPAGQVPGVARLEGLLRVYEVSESEAARLMALREIARTPGWWQGHDVQKPYGTFIGLEDASNEISSFEQSFVPGLLQTERYSRAVTLAAHAPSRVPIEDITDRVAVRLRRQQRWAERRTPHLWAIVGETALRTLVGGPDIMREQLDHLLTLADQHDILTLQVLPFSAGAHAATELASFAILTVKEAELSSVYLEGPTSDFFMDSPEDLGTYRRVFEHLRKAAMNSSDSRALITEILEGLT